MKYLESENLELKREFTSDIKKEVVAFANTGGGEIYVGISDDGSVIGIEQVDKVLLQITNVIRDAIKPDITMFTNCSVQSIEDKKVIIISVQRGTGRPYYLAEKGLKPSGVYVRQASASVPASDDAIRQMIKETDGDKYENIRSINQELTFDFAKTEFTKRGVEFSETQMVTLGIQSIDGLFTNLGLLLSDQCIHTIKIACFEGSDKGTFKDRREFGGSLFLQLQDAFTNINFFNKLNATFSGLDRIEHRDYPEDAIREALLNSIVHRDYSFSGSTLINIYDDRIEFVSLGGLVYGLSLDDIMLGISQTRNEKLANSFYRLKHIEAYGTGIIKIINSYNNNSIKPIIKATGSAFCVLLPNRNYKSDIRPMKTAHHNNEQHNKIVEVIARQGSITRYETEKLLGVKQTRASNVLSAMVREGIIRVVNAGKNSKYVLR
ncbi:MAG: RNA-binding domain-containing protein [Desulfitobacteriaceae bacterium]